MTREETFSLLVLPFLRGELTPSEKAEFESYLAENPSFETEVEFQRNLMAARPESAGETRTEFGWARLSRDIDTLESNNILAEAENPKRSDSSRIGGFWRVAAVCLACLSLGQAAFITSSKTSENYQLASENVNSGITLQIGFLADTELSDISGFLIEHDSQIISGPSKLGIYTLSFSNRETCETAIEAVKLEGQFVDTYTNCITLTED